MLPRTWSLGPRPGQREALASPKNSGNGVRPRLSYTLSRGRDLICSVVAALMAAVVPVSFFPLVVLVGLRNC
jgi:hypothetical protein